MAKLIMTEDQIEFSGTEMDQILFTNMMIDEFGLSMVERMFRDAQELEVDTMKVEEI